MTFNSGFWYGRPTPRSTAGWHGLPFPFLIISFLIGAAVRGYGDEPRWHAVTTQISSVDTALDSFEVDHARFPSTSEGLAALFNPPASGVRGNWKGPYRQQPILDSWGRSLAYTCPGIHNTNSYDLYSYGEDGVSKSNGSDPDDINNWDKSQPWIAHYNGAERNREIRKLLLIAGPALVAILTLVWWMLSLSARSKRSDEST